MSDKNPGVAEVISTFYEKYILRDLLSFIMPGFILLLAVSMAYNRDPREFFTVGLFIGAVLVSYPLGYSLQCLLEGVLRPLGIVVEPDETFSKRHAEFHYAAIEDPLARQQRERLVVFKQMAGNNSPAMIFAAGVLFSKHLIGAAIILLIVAALLGYGFALQYERQLIWENLIIEKKCGQPIPRKKPGQ